MRTRIAKTTGGDYDAVKRKESKIISKYFRKEKEKKPKTKYGTWGKVKKKFKRY